MRGWVVDLVERCGLWFASLFGCVIELLPFLLLGWVVGFVEWLTSWLFEGDMCWCVEWLFSSVLSLLLLFGGCVVDLVERLMVWCVDWLFGWLLGLLAYLFPFGACFGWRVNSLIVCHAWWVDCLIGCLVGSLVCRYVCCFVGWSIWLDVLLVDCLMGWLSNGLIGC